MLNEPFSRRKFLAGTGAAAAGVAFGGLLRPALAAPAPPVLDAAGVADAARRAASTNVLIVGTGYGGSVTALRLAQAGISSVLLERGRRWPITDAQTTFAEPPTLDGRIAWLSSSSPLAPGVPLDVYTGVIEAVAGTGIIALTGAGVGGGSLVNNAVMLQPPIDRLRHAIGDRINVDRLADTWYPRARQLIGVEPMPDDVYGSSYYQSARSFFDHGTNAGLPTFRADMAVNWNDVRAEIAGTKLPAFIVAESIFGCNSGAKRSVDRTILAQAEATGKATVQPLTRVVDIYRHDNRYLVVAERIDEHGNVLSRPTYCARHVVLAAGSIGTTRLLLRARARTLSRIPDTVGTLWGTNGDHQTVRVNLPNNNPTQGGPSGIVVQDPDNANGPTSVINFPWPFPLPDGSGVLAGLAMAITTPAGRMTYDAAADTYGLNWPTTDAGVVRATTAVTGTLDRMNTANGTVTFRNSPERTSHTLGGAVLGIVTDVEGRVRNNPNLWVIDGSLLPGTALSVPPALTITAVADYLVTNAIRKRRIT